MRNLLFDISMIYKTLLLVIILYLPLCSHGQKDSILNPKKSLDIDISNQISGQSGGFIVPTLAWCIDRHNIAIGPRINYAESWGGDPNFGAILSYKIFPNHRANRFNFFFVLNTDYFSLYRAKVFNSITIGNVTSHPKNLLFLENTVGYGFQVAFLKLLYVRFETAVGVVNMWETYYDKVSDRWTEPTILVQLSLGYRVFKHFIKTDK